MPRGRARRSIATTRERIPHRQGDRRRPSRGTSRPTGKTGETREGNPIGSQRIHSTCSPTDLIFIIFESGGKGSLFCNGKKRSRFDSAQPNDTSKKCFLSLEKPITNPLQFEFFTTHTGLTPLSCLEGILFSQSSMPQLDKFTYFTQFFWLCLFFFTFYIFICNDGDGVLGISRILKLRNQLVSHRGNNSLRPRNDPNSLEDILRKGFSTGVSYMYSSLFEVSQWCKAVDLLGKRKKITLISCFGEISGSRGMERNIFYLISKSSYSTSSNPGWGITCRNDIMLIHVLHGQGKILIEK